MEAQATTTVVESTEAPADVIVEAAGGEAVSIDESSSNDSSSGSTNESTNESTNGAEPAAAESSSDAPAPAVEEVKVEAPAAERAAKLSPAIRNAVEQLQFIDRLEQLAEEARIAFEDAKSRANRLKKAHEARVADVLAAVREWRNDGRRPLLAAMEREDGAERAAKQRTEEEAAAAQAAADEKAWRETKIEEVGFSSRVLKALQAAELLTVGAIADYTARKGELRTIAGIGEVAQQEAEDALQALWQKRFNAQAVGKPQTVTLADAVDRAAAEAGLEAPAPDVVTAATYAAAQAGPEDNPADDEWDPDPDDFEDDDDDLEYESDSDVVDDDDEVDDPIDE